MLLSISLERLLSSQSSRRRGSRRPGVFAQIEQTEPRLCLSATAVADPGFDAFEDEYSEFEAVWFEADADAYSDDFGDWSEQSYWYEDYWYDDFADAEFSYSDEFVSDWFIGESWYESDTWTDAGWYGDAWVTDGWIDNASDWNWDADTSGWDGDWFWSEDYAWAADDEFWFFGDDALLPDEDVEFPFGNDALIPTDLPVLYGEFTTDVYETVEFDFADDAHAMEEGIVFESADGFTCELFFEDDTAVTEILLAGDSFTFENDTAFDVDYFEDDFGSSDFSSDEVVFVDEFVFINDTAYTDGMFFDDAFYDDTSGDFWDDQFVDVSFSADFGPDSFTTFDSYTGDSDFELVVDSGKESVTVDVLVLDATIADAVSGDFIIEVQDLVTEVIADVHGLNADFAADFSADGSFGSEILDVIVEVDSESIDGKTSPVISSITVVSSVDSFADDPGSIAGFDDASGAFDADTFADAGTFDDAAGTFDDGTGTFGDAVDGFADGPDAKLPLKDAGIVADTFDTPQFDFTAVVASESGDIQVAAIGPGDAALAFVIGPESVQGDVTPEKSEAGDNPVKGEALTGSLADAARDRRNAGHGDRTYQGRKDVNNRLARRLKSRGRAGHISADQVDQQTGTGRSEREIPLTSAPVSEQAQPQLTQQSATAANYQRSAHSRLDRMIRAAAAQASRLTSQSGSESRNVSFDAALLAFEHPSLSMQLDGLPLPDNGDIEDGASESHGRQHGYAQMASAAGTIAIAGAAGVHFTQRRGWSMLLRIVRALLGRI